MLSSRPFARSNSGQSSRGAARSVSRAQMSSMTWFGLVYALTFVLSLAVWFFYRSVYENTTPFLVPIVISLVTSYICTHALTGGRSPHN